MGSTVPDHLPERPRVVLVTGVSRPLGARLAGALQADPAIDRVIGADTAVPQTSLGRTEYVRAGLRTAPLTSVLESAGVDTVVHAGLCTASRDAGETGAGKDVDVIGTIQLLAACQRATTVRRLVVRSTAAVYGSSPHAPALFTEEMEPVGLPRRGYAKDAWEAEGYVRGFARRRRDVSVTVLRFVNFMGPGVDSAVTRYLTLPVVPTVLGFDPRLQFVHEDDGLEALRRVTVQDHPGIFNVSGRGVVMLSQAIRRAGRPALPLPASAVGGSGDVLRRLGIVDVSPEHLTLLSHGRAVDASALSGELGWEPPYSTLGAFDNFVRGRELSRLLPVDVVDRVSAALGGVAHGNGHRPARPGRGEDSRPGAGATPPGRHGETGRTGERGHGSG